METLNGAERNAVLSALYFHGTYAWERTASCYEIGFSDMAAYWAEVCRDSQSAYAKLWAWPNEPDFQSCQCQDMPGHDSGYCPQCGLREGQA